MTTTDTVRRRPSSGRALWLPAALVAGIMAGGCSSDTSNGDEAPVEVAATIPGDQGEPEHGRATTAQYASVIAPHERKWREHLDSAEENCAPPAIEFACRMSYMTLGLNAETVKVVLEGIREVPDHPDYLGEPPDEIARLVERTIEAAVAVTPATDAWADAGCHPDDGASGCGPEWLGLRMAISDMTSAFDAWRPYL